MKRGNIGILIAAAAYLTYKAIKSRKILQLKKRLYSLQAVLVG